MKRRQFTTTLAATSLGLTFLDGAHAQGAPVAGTDYEKIDPPAPISSPPGKIDVVEFFSYACPHCNAFEPTLEKWVKRLPADVHFHRVPVTFLFNAVNFQPMYYALESMNAVDAMQQNIFNAVHVDRLRLDKPDDIAAFMKKNGIDATRFMAAFNSFGVRTKVQQVEQLMDANKVHEVPVIVVQGRYLTSPGHAKGEEQATKVADYLIQQVRSGH